MRTEEEKAQIRKYRRKLRLAAALAAGRESKPGRPKGALHTAAAKAAMSRNHRLGWRRRMKIAAALVEKERGE